MAKAKRSTASYKAAAKKAAATRRRNAKKGTTSVTKRTTTVTKRRRRATKKGVLSEIMTPAAARGAAMAAAAGFGGGAITKVLDKLLDTMPKPPGKGARILTYLGGSFLLAAMFKAPNMAAGMAGVAAYKMMEVVGLSEEDNAKFARDIEKMPAMLNKDGQPMAENINNYLQQNGAYLQDYGDGTEYLQQQGYQVSYAPNFGAPEGGFQGY